MLRRREAAPPEIVRLLAKDDRVVSWARAVDGVVLASRHGLWWPDPAGSRMIGWHLIDKAVWDEGRLTVTEAEVVDDLILRELSPVTLQIEQPRDLPPTIRKRVETSVVRSEVVILPGGAVRLVARRVTGRDGVSWWARLEAGTSDTPDVRADVEDVLGQLRARSAAELIG
jgi:hypothetical protein